MLEKLEKLVGVMSPVSRGKKKQTRLHGKEVSGT
jgi:hypothetical protein